MRSLDSAFARSERGNGNTYICLIEILDKVSHTAVCEDPPVDLSNELSLFQILVQGIPQDTKNAFAKRSMRLILFGARISCGGGIDYWRMLLIGRGIVVLSGYGVHRSTSGEVCFYVRDVCLSPGR